MRNLKKIKLERILFITILFIALASVGFAQRQTGSIRGKITDEEGNPIPGVNVTITSPALMGTQSFVSTAGGDFRFPACPPGEYVVRAEFSGFQTIDRPGVIVHVGMTIDVNITMKPTTISEEITITAPSPMVDMKSPKLTVPITSDMIKSIPVSRDLYDLIQTAPSYVEEGGQWSYRKMGSVHGGGIWQSTYSLDGTDISDPQYGYISLGVAFDAIEEVEMASGAHQAEVPYASAGFINVVSKSGGNNFSGGFTGQYTSEKMQSSTFPENELRAMGFQKPLLDKYNWDLSVTLGGPIIKDRLWFFLNPQLKRSSRGTPFIPFTDPLGIFHGAYDIKMKEWAGLFKLTNQISKKLKYMGMYQWMGLSEDPISIIAFWYLPYEGSLDTKDRTHILSNVLTYTIDQNTFAEARFGYVARTRDHVNVQTKLGTLTPLHNDRFDNRIWGGYLFANEDNTRKKGRLELNMTRYQDDFLGANHEFKAGASYGWYKVQNEFPRKNPFALYWYKGTPWYYHDTVPYMGRVHIYGNPPDLGYMPQLNSEYDIGLFAQDTINIRKRLFLSVGLRFDTEHYSRPEEVRKGWQIPYYNGLAHVLLPDIFPTYEQKAAGIKDVIVWSILQPRIGLIYDLFGNGKTALKASFSRYTDFFSSSMAGALHPFGAGATFTWWDDNKNGTFDLPPVDRYFCTSIPRIITDPEEYKKTIDPDLSAPYVDEYTASINREVMKDFSMSLNFIYKENKNITGSIDKANPLDGNMWLPYTVTDPGNDEKFGTGDDQQLTVYALKREAESPFYYRTNVKELKRKYWGVELVAFKRMSKNWQLSGSVTYSKQYGNVGAGWGDQAGGGTIYTNPNNLINRWGRLNWDRPLIVKLMGTVILPYGINLSAYYSHASGTLFTTGAYGSAINRTVTVYFPATVGGFIPKSPTVTVNAEPPGARRNKSTDSLNIRIEKEFRLGFGRLGVYADAFNVLGFSKTSFDQNNGGYIFANGTFQRFPTYGRITLAEGVRVTKITLRYSF